MGLTTTRHTKEPQGHVGPACLHCKPYVVAYDMEYAPGMRKADVVAMVDALGLGDVE